FHLPGRGLSQLLAAVAHIDIPQTGQSVDELAPVRRTNGRAAALNPDERFLLIVRMKQWMNKVIVIGVDDLVNVDCDCHFAPPAFCKTRAACKSKSGAKGLNVSTAIFSTCFGFSFENSIASTRRPKTNWPSRRRVSSSPSF